HDPSAPRTIEHEREVAVMGRGGEAGSRRHRNTLYVYKPVYGQVLSELPFSHPKQLVALMPNLRQYALLSTLLKRSFGDGEEGVEWGRSTRSTGAGSKRHGLDGLKSDQAAGRPGGHDAGAMDVDAPPGDEGVRSVDVTLTVHPAPRLQVVFPLRASTANVGLEIGPSGTVRVTSQNVLPEEGGEGGFTVEKLGRALEVLEDIDQWCEWIRTRVDGV
ncbi:hypothetical protein IMZ48_27400, partial [Candidatus Bathyarchaeota archaeon]|nr:hypothetical protein [Candidatus Bathyarchaeota archaeon]